MLWGVGMIRKEAKELRQANWEVLAGVVAWSRVVQSKIGEFPRIPMVCQSERSSRLARGPEKDIPPSVDTFPHSAYEFIDTFSNRCGSLLEF